MLRVPNRLKTFQTHSHRRSPVQEHELAKAIGGERVRGSGSGITKGDVRKKGVCRIEVKTTGAASFSVTRDMMRKIDEAAVDANEIPALVVEFNDKGKPVGSVCIMPYYVVEMLFGK